MVSKKLNFCTYINKNYLTRFLTLKSSIDLFFKDYIFYVLALDNTTINFLKKNKNSNIKFIRLKNFENYFKILKKLKKKRSIIEYYFTLSPFVPLYLKEKFNLKQLMYLDSDLFFLKNPKPKIKSFDKNSVTIIKQNSNPIYGKYNVGLINYNFKYKETFKILKIWQQQCTDWCYDRVEKNKFADQKYLDQWPMVLKKILILNPEKIMISPWDQNCCKLIYSYMKNKNKSDWYLFHFHGMTIFNVFFSTGISIYKRITFKDSVYKFYMNYIKKIKFFENKIKLNSKSIRYKSNNSLINLLRIFKRIIFAVSRQDFFKIKQFRL